MSRNRKVANAGNLQGVVESGGNGVSAASVPKEANERSVASDRSAGIEAHVQNVPFASPGRIVAKVVVVGAVDADEIGRAMSHRRNRISNSRTIPSRISLALTTT